MEYELTNYTKKLFLKERARSMPHHADLKCLTGPQLRIVLEAAQTLRMRSREKFLQAVAQSLAGCPEIGDGAVNRVVRQVLEEDRLFGERLVRL
jgi:hypothetical protein